MRYSTLFVLLFLLLTFISCRHTTPEQKRILVVADSLLSSRPDSSLLLLRKIGDYRRFSSSDLAHYVLVMVQALDKCDTVLKSDTLISIATGYYGNRQPKNAGYAWFYQARCENNRGNAKGQAGALLKAQEYALMSGDHKLIGCVCSEKAKMYQSQNQLDSMLHYNELAYINLKAAGDKRNCVVCLMVIGYSYYLDKQYDKALRYYAQALKECSGSEPMLTTSLCRLQGLCYYCKKDYGQALYFTRLSNRSADTYDYSKAINMAMIFDKMNLTDSARHYLHMCADPHDMAAEYYRILVNISAKDKKFEDVLEYTDKLIIAKDSIHKHSLSESFAGLEKKYKYENISLQNKTLVIQNQKNSIVILMLLLLISIGVIGFTIFRNKQNKKMLTKQRLLTEREKELSKNAEERVSILQRQISIQQNALGTLNKLKSEMAELSQGKSARGTAKSLFTVREQATIDDLILHVKENVDLLYNNISDRLQDRFPSLKANDVMICCFLLAGFDNVTIYTTLNLQPGSYNVKRTNLRKKLGLTHETNLTDFLASF
jgi:tetratricopeptide (TPR) repeat protein